jgi:hypothetical protein
MGNAADSQWQHRASPFHRNNAGCDLLTGHHLSFRDDACEGDDGGNGDSK